MCILSKIYQYVGSFPVSGSEQNSRSELIRRYSQSLRSRSKPKPVLLVISLTGIKVCSPDASEVYMGHALRRISYSSCEPSLCLFSFLAREPKAQPHSLYCHTFLASNPQKAEELNSIVGNAFRMAYAAHLQPNLPQVIQKNIDTDPQPIVWPKQIPGKAEMREVSRPETMPGLGFGPGSTVNYPVEDSNSPTELNSCHRLADKPQPVKRIPITPSAITPPAISADDKLSDSSRLSSEDGKRSCSSGNGGSPPPAPPERTQSLRPETEGELKTAPWFQAGIPREITLEVLGQEPVGSFMVRESTSKPGCYALSLRVPREFQPHGIAHYLILRTNKGFKIKGFTKEFSSLTALITHHSVMPELLPCPLSLSRYNPSYTKSDTSKDFVDIGSDPDYNTLADFRKMMADLNV